MKKKHPSLSESTVVVVSHIFADGPAQALVKYLCQKNIAKEVLFIGHPLLPRPNEESLSFFQFFTSGKETWSKEKRNIGQRFSLHYLENFFVSIFWVLKTKEKWDIYIGANNLNALSGLVLKSLGKVKKVVFYGVDYVPQRFSHPLVNSLYHLFDRLVVLYADEIWNLSPRMVEARRKYKNLEIDPWKSKIVPMGIWFNEIKRVPFSKIEKHTLVFMGHLLKKQGVQLVIQAMPEVLKKIPDFKFLIIGKGEYEDELRKIAISEKVEKHVSFAGYIEDHEEMEKIMSRCACAVALYEKGDLERNYTYYADPGKIKDYLGAGLPVILTDVPHNARTVENESCGIVIDGDKESIASAVIQLMTNTKSLNMYRRNALKFARKSDWIIIFNKSFSPK